LTRIRLLFVACMLAVLATGLVACGGGGDNGSGEDPQKVLDQTFSGDNEKVTSGDLSLSVKVNTTGKDSGSFDASLSGPFENQGDNKVPKLDLQVSASGSGNGQDFNFDGGLTSTGDAAFVNYKGTDYEVDQSIFDQFKSQIESATGQQQSQQSAGEFFKQLGIDNPKSLLTNLSNDGTDDVEGTETNHISGDVDVGKAVDSFKSLLGSASLLQQLGGSSANLPSPDQLDQVKDAVKEAHFDIYSGTDDHILRRLTIAVSIEPPSGTTDKVDLNLDFTIGGVNEPQTVEAPSNPKPLRDLLSKLGVPASALGQLGALGGGVPGSGITGKGTPSSPPSGAPSGVDTQQAQKYLQCISQAGSAADLQKCQSLAP
jgi:hypothetical protein